MVQVNKVTAIRKHRSSTSLVIGSSGHVYLAAGLVNLANSHGARSILVNFELPINGSDFDEVHIGKAGEILPDLVDNW